MLHCHIGEHEDGSMVQTIEMSRDAGRCEPGTPSTTNRLSMSPMGPGRVSTARGPQALTARFRLSAKG
jgi:hypothetical protein